MNRRFLSDPGKLPALRKIMAFHDAAEGKSYFHEALAPFTFSLMSIRSDAPEKSTLSIYTPEASVNLPPSPEYMPEMGLSLHHHNCYELTYVLSGSLDLVVEGRRYYYPAGSCFLMNRNTLHAEESGTDFTCIFLTVTDAFIRRLREEGRHFLFPGEQAVFENRIFSFFDREPGEQETSEKDFLDFVPRIDQQRQELLVHRHFEQMLRTLIDPDCGATWELQAQFLRLVRILCDESCFRVQHVTWESNLEKLLLARVDRILSQRHGRITNRELAELLHYNGSYLGRIVKKHTGKSLFDYSMDFAMSYAAARLRQTELSASAIAAELHFTNHTHFYRIFKERFGVTPSEYRRIPRQQGGEQPET